MTILLLAILAPYFTLVLLLWWFWINPKQTTQTPEGLPFISVIIVVRNEEENIGSLLHDLDNQSFPLSKVEVIVIDDDSTDNTREIVESTKKRVSYKLQVASRIEKGDSPKKAGITQAAKIAAGDLLVMTDGDCRVGREWLSAISEAFQDPNCKVVFGPVTYQESSSFFGKIQDIELAALIGTGAGTLRLGIPSMCNGANISIDRRVFHAVGEYSGLEKVISGDDELLMHRVYRSDPASVKFLKDRRSLVTTPAHLKLSDLVNQRNRWASKWAAYELVSTKLLALFIFTVHLTSLTFIGFTAAGIYSIAYFLWVMAIKMVVEYMLVRSVMSFNRQRISIPAFMVLQLAYSLYVVIIALTSRGGKFSWKGRVYRQ